MEEIASQDQIEIPDEIKQMVMLMREQKQGRIESLGKAVARKRDEAIKGRRESGVEKIWLEDEEYYYGIDDASRESTTVLKAAGTTGGLSRNIRRTNGSRCSAFFNVIRQFCDSASARMGDILLPAGDWNFHITPTPVPDMGIDQFQQQQAAKQIQGAQIPGQSPMQQGQMAAQNGALAPIAAPGAAPSQPQVAASSQADAACEKAEKRIQDWLVECSYHSEVRKALESAAIYGTGILEGPVPQIRKKRRMTQQDGQPTLEIIEETVPGSLFVDKWDFFPDQNCGDNIHDGEHVIRRKMMTARQLRDLKGVDGYLPDQIDKVIDEGPNQKNYSDGMRVNEKTSNDDRYEAWYFYGLIDLEDLDAMGVQANEGETRDLIPAVVVLVNETPIKAFLNPLDSGDFPFDVMPWQAVAGMPWGVGVCRQGRTAQEMLNAAMRAMMDNGGLTSRPQLIIRQNAITPADGNWEVTAGKIWFATEQADVRSVADAIMPINIPTMQNEMGAMVQMAMKLLEDSTGMFFIMQGQQGAAPDTVGGMELLNRNASAVLRRLARTFDERVTEPHIRRYYEWLMMYGEDDSEKGDFQIEAIGSTALVERDIHAQQAVQLLQMSVNPAFGLDPEAAMEEVLKSMRFVPDKLKLSDEKKAQMAQRQPMIPAIEVAKIRAQTDMAKIEADKWATKVEATQRLHQTDVGVDRDTAYNNALAERDKINSEMRAKELEVKRELEILKYANQQKLTLEQVKADLATNAAKINLERELSTMSMQLEAHKHTTPSADSQVMTPPVEVAGRAPNGEAFAR